MEISEGTYTLAGVVLGSILTQLSTWLGTRQADKRIAKEVLYFLLELHRLLNALERVNRLMPQFITIIRQHTAAPRPDMASAVDEMLEDVLRNVSAPLIGQQLAALKNDYNAGLLKLATIDPISAYRLRGLDDLLQKVPKALEAVQNASATHLGEALPIPTGITAFMREHLEAIDVVETIAQVRAIMQELVGQLDRKTQRKLAEELINEEGREQEALLKYNDFMKKAGLVFPPISK